MSLIRNILTNLPEVRAPKQKRLSFKEKMKWTIIVLVLFFVLSIIPLVGLGDNQLQRFEILSVILGAKFGSIISLGIGPIVTASIVLQLLNGSGLLKFDLTSPDGKRMFQGVQKAGAIFFIIFEAIIYVLTGGLAPKVGISPMLLIFQLCLGGLLIMFMDEVVSKWGFGSGISLFIAAGVSETIFTRALSPLPSPTNPAVPVGAIPTLIQSLARSEPQTAMIMLAAVIATILVFVIAVYAQAMKAEIPLSFGRIRGHGIRWPLAFMYTSNIPVILVAALLANIQLWAGLLGVGPDSKILLLFSPPNVVNKILTGGFSVFPGGHGIVYALMTSDLFRMLFYMAFMVIGAVIFSIFWVQTSGMDSKSQAQQMISSGLQIPGFRRDERILERLLDRYITPLTVMGAIAVGFLAAMADLSGALGSGTGILLTVMIVYKLYEEIAQQHMMDMHPMMRKFIGK